MTPLPGENTLPGKDTLPGDPPVVHPADVALWEIAGPWTAKRHVAEAKTVSDALALWAKARQIT